MCLHRKLSTSKPGPVSRLVERVGEKCVVMWSGDVSVKALTGRSGFFENASASLLADRAKGVAVAGLI